MSFSARWRDIPTRPLVREALDWQQYAVCRNEPLELFFGPDRHEGESQRKERESRAKMFCSGCPVRTECLDYSITQPEKYGTWGGLNENERAAERRRRMRRHQPSQVNPRPKPKKPRPKQTRVLVDTTGARRRLRATSVMGRALRTYARVAGVPETTLSRIRSGSEKRTSKKHVERIAAAYERVLALQEVYPAAQRAAVEGGWWGPDAWVGVDIDDPEAVPKAPEAA